MQINLTLDDKDYNNNKTAAILYAIADLFASGNAQSADLSRFETPESNPIVKMAEARAGEDHHLAEVAAPTLPMAEQTAPTPLAAEAPKITTADIQKAAAALVMADGSKRDAVVEILKATGAAGYSSIPADQVGAVADQLRALGASI